MMRLRLQLPTRSLFKAIPRRVRAACDGDGLIVVSAPTTADVAAVAAAVGDLAGRQRGGYVISLRAAGSARHDISGAFVSQREFSGSDGDVAAAIRSAASELPDVLRRGAADFGSGDARSRQRGRGRPSGHPRRAGADVDAGAARHRRARLRGRRRPDAPGARDVVPRGLRLSRCCSVSAAAASRCAISSSGTSEVSAMLASGDFPGIARLQREGGMSMTTVDDSLARAVRRGQLSLRQAASHAVDKKYLVNLVRIEPAPSPASQPTVRDLPTGVLEPVSSSRQRWSSY